MMRIRSIQINNFRKFTAPVNIRGLAEGINVIAGDNEDGKSTILQALKAAFCVKHSSIAQAKEFQPYGSAVLPEVGVEFEIASEKYLLRKSFGKRGAAELQCPTGKFVGSEAEEKLHDLCLMKGAEKKETSIWGVLWVDQGTAFASPAVGDLGKRTLEGALEGELGKIVGGTEGQDLFKRVEALYEKWFTSKGKDKTGKDASELVEAQNALQEIEEAYTRCLEQVEQYEQMLASYDAIKAKLKEHEDKSTVAIAQAKVSQFQQQLAQVVAKRQALDTLKQTETAKQFAYKNIQSAFNARTAAREELQTAQKQLVDTRAALSDLKQNLEAAGKLLHELQTAKSESEQRAKQAEALLNATQAAAELRRAQQELAAAEGHLMKAKQAESQAQATVEKGKAIKVTTKAIQALRELQQEIAVGEGQLKTLGTKLEFQPLAGKQVLRGDAPCKQGEPLVITETTTFHLEGWGELVVAPGAGALEDIRTQAAQNKADFQAQLKAIGAGSFAEAESMEQARKELGEQYKAFTAEIARYAPAGVAALEDECRILTAKVSALKERCTATPLDTEATAEALAEARVRYDHERKGLSEISQRSQQAESNYYSLDGKFQSCAAQEKILAEQEKSAAQKLEALRQEEPDQSLTERLAVATVESTKAREAREFAENELRQLNADSLETACESAKRELEKASQEIQQLHTDYTRLGGILQGRGSGGIQEELARLKGKKELQESRLKAASRKARAVKLLYETLRSAEKESKEQLLAPLLRHLEPYVTDVFDNGKLVLDQTNFSITHLKRNNHDESYSALSLGTREQLSVLTRLAFAQVLSETGMPSIVVLDDALVYADEERLNKMQAILKRASEKFQVLILTCRVRDYAEMGAPIIYLSECMNTGATLAAPIA